MIEHLNGDSQPERHSFPPFAKGEPRRELPTIFVGWDAERQVFVIDVPHQDWLHYELVIAALERVKDQAQFSLNMARAEAAQQMAMQRMKDQAETQALRQQIKL